MARRKNQPESVRVKCDLSERLREIRAELHGERGGSEMARRLGLPIRTWYNYESGVTVPAEVILKFVELTSVEPLWLLHGRGPKFRETAPAVVGGDSVEVLLRAALQKLETRRSFPDTFDEPTPAAEENGDVVLMRVEDGHEPERLGNGSGARFMAARREWLAARQDCRVVRMDGHAMAPLIGDGAYVAFSDTKESIDELDGRLVVAWVENRPVVRWLKRSGRYCVLRAENAAHDPATILMDLTDEAADHRVRRVLWISTPR